MLQSVSGTELQVYVVYGEMNYILQSSQEATNENFYPVRIGLAFNMVGDGLTAYAVEEPGSGIRRVGVLSHLNLLPLCNSFFPLIAVTSLSYLPLILY